MRLTAGVWWCGDEVCDCHQARIEWHGRDAQGRPDIRTVWAGTFYTDGEGWRTGGYRTELNRAAAWLRRRWPAAYHAVTWPWS